MLREQITALELGAGWGGHRNYFYRYSSKGIMDAEEATRAMAAGAAGLYVSNYGGRSIDWMPSAISALPKVRAAVGKETPIIFDSGIRRGSDIAAAIALGANVVALGRSVGYGLAADGEAGARRVLKLLKAEFWTTLGHLGCSRVDELHPGVFSQ